MRINDRNKDTVSKEEKIQQAQKSHGKNHDTGGNSHLGLFFSREPMEHVFSIKDIIQLWLEEVAADLFPRVV